jgi:hypothetical protein
MEGWYGVDRTLHDVQFFRRMNNADFPGSGQSACKMTGSYFFWCGVLPSESVELCFSAGQGYGNNWNVCIEQAFAYNGSGSVSLAYDYEVDLELGLDFTYVLIDTSGNDDDVQVAAYTDVVAGTEGLTLTPGTSLPNAAGPITIKFCVITDGSWSDEDGLYTTNCGAFGLDNVSLSGGGITYSSDFETGEDGWILSDVEPGQGGDWANIVHVVDLPPPLTDCVCNFSDSVLVFEDLNAVGSHNIYQNNFAASPWIDLLDAGLVGAPGKFVEADIYADMPVLNYMYAQFMIRWYPNACSGGISTSPWALDELTHYFGGVPTCTQDGSPFRTDFSAIIDSGAEQVQIGMGIFSACLFFANCSGLTNTSPWFDNVKFGVCGTFGAGPATPVVSARPIDLPQDSFPEDGTLGIGSPGRVDSGTIKGAAEPGPNTSLGDTLVVQGASGGAEVWVQFAVRPGPGTDPTDLSSFLGQVTFEESKDGLDWYSARMDTAEQGGVPGPGSWMTAFHEDYPAFVGSDTDIDLNDVDPLGGTNRLANDIFPDNLFAPGTRLNLFYKSKFTAGSTWYTAPDTSGGNYLEMEVLPSSFSEASSFNCVLYVDHFDGRGAQAPIEGGLAAVVPGDSPNWESTRWDRYDVRAPSSHQATFGRPSGTEYGATTTQASAYKTIIWNSGNLDAFNLVDEDAQVLMPWLILDDPGGNTLFLSGDGIATSMTLEAPTDPNALELLQNVAGVVYDCATFRDLDCPTGTPMDATVCVGLDPVSGARVSTRPHGGNPKGQGNACPLNRSFDVLGLNPFPTYGAPRGEEEYTGDSKTVQFASVSSRNVGNVDAKTVVDGISLHYRRKNVNCLHGAVTTESIEERLEEVLAYFGYSGNFPACVAPGIQIGIGDDPPVRPGFKTALANFSPNPLSSHRQGRIQFTMAREAPAKVDIYDLNGRLVKTVFEATAAEGENTVFWDGTDASNRAVASGVYFYSLKTGGEQYARKLVVARN